MKTSNLIVVELLREGGAKPLEVLRNSRIGVQISQKMGEGGSILTELRYETSVLLTESQVRSATNRFLSQPEMEIEAPKPYEATTGEYRF